MHQNLVNPEVFDNKWKAKQYINFDMIWQTLCQHPATPDKNIHYQR